MNAFETCVRPKRARVLLQVRCECQFFAWAGANQQWSLVKGGGGARGQPNARGWVAAIVFVLRMFTLRCIVWQLIQSHVIYTSIRPLIEPAPFQTDSRMFQAATLHAPLAPLLRTRRPLLPIQARMQAGSIRAARLCVVFHQLDDFSGDVFSPCLVISIAIVVDVAGREGKAPTAEKA